MELVAQGAHIALAEHLRELLGPERGGAIQERVTPLAARGLASETTKYLIEKPIVTFSVELDAGRR
jgi:hypothetical protein